MKKLLTLIILLLALPARLGEIVKDAPPLELNTEQG